MALIQFVFNQVVGLYLIVLLVSVVLSWLRAFGVINPYNQVVMTISSICDALTEPLLRPIRRYVPPVGGLDLSFIVLYIGVLAFRFGVNTYVFNPLIGAGIP